MLPFGGGAPWTLVMPLIWYSFTCVIFFFLTSYRTVVTILWSWPVQATRNSSRIFVNSSTCWFTSARIRSSTINTWWIMSFHFWLVWLTHKSVLSVTPAHWPVSLNHVFFAWLTEKRWCSFKFSSGEQKWGSHISLERIDLESLNFTRTSIPTCSRATPDMTPLTTSCLKLTWKTIANVTSDDFRWNFSRTVWARSPKFYMFIGAQSALTNLPDMTSPAISGRLQDAIKYCTKVHRTGPAGQRVE